MRAYLRKSLTSPWLFVMVGHWLTSGMERSLARWEESQGMRVELDETQRTKHSVQSNETFEEVGAFSSGRSKVCVCSCAFSQLCLQLQHDGLQLLLLLLALDRQLLHFGSQTLVLRLHIPQLRLPQAYQLLQVTLPHENMKSCV